MTGIGPTHTLPDIRSVVGGAAGISAAYAEMRALADRLDETSALLAGLAADDARMASSPVLLGSAPLSPVTFAEAEARVLAAGAGLDGALGTSLAFEADAVLVRSQVAAYDECDRLVAESLSVLDRAVGQAVGSLVSTGLLAFGPELAVLAAAGVGLAPVARQGWERLPRETRMRLDGEAGVLLDEVQQRVGDHPGLVEHAVDGSGGFLDGLLGPVGAGGVLAGLAGGSALAGLAGLPGTHPTAGDAATTMSGLYPPERPPRVRPRDDLAVPLGQSPPGDLEDLMRHLEQTNDLSPGDRPGDQGTIEVQTLRSPDGVVRHIVYLPGTDDLATPPWRPGHDVRDLPADLRQIGGADTTYAEGIRRAMTAAGVAPHDPVLLVGHSLGGMEAAHLLAHGSGFDVRDVVTAGSPIGGVDDYPAGSHVLSLENRGDVVPLLDGRPNADSVPHVTVAFDDRETSIVGNHDLRHYVRGAAAIDASQDPSVREQLDALRIQGFLGSEAVATSQVLQVTR